MTGIDRILTISELKARLDPLAIKALTKTSEHFNKKYPDSKQIISQKGITGYIETLSDHLNNSILDDTTRVLLSKVDIYAALIQQILDQEVVDTKDVKGLYHAVQRSVEQEPRKYFLARLLTEVLNAKHIQIQPGERKWHNLDELALKRGIPIRDGKVEHAVEDILDVIYKQGDLPHYLDEYIKKGEIEEHNFTSDIKQGMIDYLVNLGLNIKSEAEFQKSTYDEYFALAYSAALKRRTVTDDPIDVARTKDDHSDWDFSVHAFDSNEEQGIIPANIKAAGVLDYVYYIGERMHVFDVTNALVLRWANGSLDIPEGEAAAGLYRFHKLRHERSTPEERAMLYKRILNRGNGQLLSSMMPNEAFSRYWHTLMSEVTEYIRRSEGMRRGDNQPSRSQLYQAVRNLQYNLTDYMTGMSHLQVTEDYAHLQEAIKILKTEEIINHFGGRRRNLWDVIERIAKEDLGITVQTYVTRTLAVEGDKVYKWIADFHEATVREQEFKAFLQAAESWIIAQASLQETNGSYRNGNRRGDFGDMNDDFEDEDNFDDDFNDDFDNDDDFDDW
ncbi:MAG: hypothetical protein F6K18_05250 [Okeania sp. SIO2C2]|uniref:hypothetical protein n=1 Tax=Okeania sp. SIO2C2 TaxID=2607787 RepID=UPI0013BC7C16|nr:hypothetical protein [Okeania sp. SIO2C2]NEP86275.1 hypothetical protein [Okeania sp. SIO2C2]